MQCLSISQLPHRREYNIGLEGADGGGVGVVTRWLSGTEEVLAAHSYRGESRATPAIFCTRYFKKHNQAYTPHSKKLVLCTVSGYRRDTKFCEETPLYLPTDVCAEALEMFKRTSSTEANLSLHRYGSRVPACNEGNLTEALVSRLSRKSIQLSVVTCVQYPREEFQG